MPEKGASGDVDYPWEDADGSDGVDVFDDEYDESYVEQDGHVDAGSHRDLDYLLGEQAHRHDGFDAFDESTWDDEVFTPVAATPWYRSRQALPLLIASGAAVSALVVSVVLLLVRDSSPGAPPVPSPTTTAVTTPVATATSRQPPPPAPPPPAPPPPPEEAPPQPPAVNQAPAPVIRPPARPRQTKEPEIGVTRTQETRSPISVAPQPRRPR